MTIDLERRLLLVMAAQLGVAGLTGCGTILHPERRGQPPGGRLDWGVVVLDALGLLFFFIPGIIAFAVDFSTGAIYLPPEYPPAGYPLAQGPLEKVQASSPQPSVGEVEEIVSKRVGRPVKLEPGEVVSEPLAEIGDFWAVQKRYVLGKAV